jgi:hypothetical protein
MVRELQSWHPACIDLVDTDENGLVDLVREAHASGVPFSRDSAIAALDFTGPEFAPFVRSRPIHDFVLNFAALKHVRSESDPFTAMRMLRVNALSHGAVLALLSERPPQRYFVVSSDKAVRPANLLGASKALMERLALARSAQVPFASARFANVAFSRGSLLDSFLQRLERAEPFAGPSDVRRYFIAREEAAELCLLGCCAIPAGAIVAPPQDERLTLQSFPEIAEKILQHFGFVPLPCTSAAEAVQRARDRKSLDPQWPCFFSPSNTSGEKPTEEFISPGEGWATDPQTGITIIHQPLRAPQSALDTTVSKLEHLLTGRQWTRSDLIEAVRLAVPEFVHAESNGSLHQKL